MTTANDQIACPECGYGWNEFTQGFHYTHCSKVAHLSREQPASETTKAEVWTFCARGQHEHCTGEAQLTRTGPPSKCGCNCHEHHDAPAAPERSEWQVVSVNPARPSSDVRLVDEKGNRILLLASAQRGLLEQFATEHNGFTKYQAIALRVRERLADFPRFLKENHSHALGKIVSECLTELAKIK